MRLLFQGVETPRTLFVYLDESPHLSDLKAYPKKFKLEGKSLGLPDHRLIYQLDLKGLNPGTPYFFTIGDEKRCLLAEQKFHTLSTEEPLIFVEGGDWDLTEAADQLAAIAALQKPHALLLGGDYANGPRLKRDYLLWDQWLDSVACHFYSHERGLIPLVMAVGNHEVPFGYNRDKKEAPFFFKYFPQGETAESYFALSFGDRLKIFVLDSGHAAEHGGRQSVWLKEELSKSAPASIKIALYHVPLYPSLRFAAKSALYHAFKGVCRFFLPSQASRLFSVKSEEGRRFWLPLFDAYGLTLAFEHHDQALKRTKPLKGV